MASITWVDVEGPPIDSRMQLRIMTFEEFQKSARRGAVDEPSVVDLINAGLVALNGASIRHGLDEDGTKAVDRLHTRLCAMGPTTDRSAVLEVHAAIKALDIPIASWSYRSPDDAAGNDGKEAYEAYVSSMKTTNAMLQKTTF